MNWKSLDADGKMMNQISFQKSEWEDLKDLTARYFAELGYQNDGFHNGMIFDNEAYGICLAGTTVGLFSMGNSWENEPMLCAFYLTAAVRQLSVEIFEKLLCDFHVQVALVASNDALFVSLSFEKMHALKTDFEMQAYNLIYGGWPARPAEYGMEYLTEVTPDEYETMNSLTEGQWEGCYGCGEYSFYAIKDGGKPLGYGAMGRLKYNVRNVDIGNFTLPEYRRQGVGRSLMINIGKLAVSKGYTPVAGCYYGNKESILTLKSSGFIPENRLFYVKFK